MGIGLVFAFWFVVAVSGAVVLSGAAWLVSGKQPAMLRSRRALFAAALPFGMLAWVLPAGFLWVGWGALTGLHVQFGPGDSWEVPLAREYSLGFIDVGDSAAIYPPRSDAPLLGNVTRIAVAESRAYGIAGAGAFVLDTSSGRLQQGSAPELFVANGLDGSVLMPVGQFPGRPHAIGDTVVLLLLFFGLPAFTTWHVWTKRLTEHGAGRP